MARTRGGHRVVELVEPLLRLLDELAGSLVQGHHLGVLGEQAGNLDEMLERVAETYDEEVDIATQKLTALLEPLIIVVLATVVAGIVIAIVLPLLQLQRVS